jgi:Ca-activated chloride channel family protein
MQPKLLLDHELAVSQSGYVVRALLTLEGRAPDAASRVPLDLSLVLDRSGSMAGEKLDAAREAAALLVRRLRPEDVVSVVAYDDDVETVAPPADGAAQESLAGRILAIEPGGMTNLSGVWLRGHELVADAKRRMGAAGEGAMHRVLLLTDGQANVGITDPRLLVGLCAKARLAGVTTTTIGFGEGYDEGLLRAMADAGGGSTYYIERADQAPGVFEEEIEGLLSLSAQNVAVELRPSPAVQLVAVHHRYPSVPLPDGAGVRLEVGDVYAREPKALLCEFFVPALGAAAGEAVAIADVVVHAYVLTTEGGVERREVRFPIAAPLSAAGRREPEVRREMMLLEAARAREAALEARERGDYAAGSAVLAAVPEMLASLGADDPVLREEAADLRAMAARFDAGDVGSADAKYIAQRAYNAHRRKEGYAGKLRRGPRDEA